MNSVPEIRKPERIIRTTLGEYLAKPIQEFDGTAVYVLACYPNYGCLYIGISNNVFRRILEHVSYDKPLGVFLRSIMESACSFRLDILVAPDEDYEWCRQAERALVQYFRPTFNEQLLGESTC